RGLDHRDEAPLGALVLEADHAVAQGEDGEVLAKAGVVARVELGAALTDQDVACGHGLAVETLHTEALGLAVATVLGAADAFLVCHVLLLASRSADDVGDADLGVGLTVAVVPAVVALGVELVD